MSGYRTTYTLNLDASKYEGNGMNTQCQINNDYNTIDELNYVLKGLRADRNLTIYSYKVCMTSQFNTRKIVTVLESF